MARFRDFTGLEAGVSPAGWSAVPSGAALTAIADACRTGQFGLRTFKPTPAASVVMSFAFTPNLNALVGGDVFATCRFWFKAVAFPDADDHAVGGFDLGLAPSATAGIYINSSTGSTAVIGVGIDTLFVTIGTIKLGVWYRAEVDVQIHNEDSGDAADDFALVTGRVQGTGGGQGFEKRTGISTFSMARFSVGGRAAPVTTIDMYFDDLIFDANDTATAVSLVGQSAVAAIPIDAIDDPATIGFTGTDRKGISERPFITGVTTGDRLTSTTISDLVLLAHRPMRIRGAVAWKVNALVRSTPAATHDLVIDGTAFPTAIPTVLFGRVSATLYQDFTQDEFNVARQGLRNLTGDTLELNALVGEVLCNSATTLFSEADAVAGKSEPMVWFEFLDKAGTTHLWGNQDVASPQPVAGKIPFIEGRVQRLSTAARGLGEFSGQIEDIAFGFRLSDTDNVIRKLLRAEVTRAFIGRPVKMLAQTARDRFLEIEPYTVGRGVLEMYAPKSPFQFEMKASGAVFRQDRSGRNRDQIPKRRIATVHPITGVDLFLDCPEENLDLPEPQIYGKVSAQPGDQTSAAVSGVAAKGVAPSGAAPVDLVATASPPVSPPDTYAHEMIFYTGNAAPARPITGAGFQPDVVMIKAHGGGSGADSMFRTADHTGTISNTWNGAQLASQGIESLDPDGFTVGTDNRVNQTGVRYVALCIFKGDETLFRHGTYTGDGNDDRIVPISTGFQPDYLFVKNKDTGPAVFRGTAHSGDESDLLGSTAVTANLIQAFNANGFEVGDEAAVNESGKVFFFWAWRSLAGALDVFFEVGTYVGDGGTKTVSGLTNTPTWLLIKPQANGNDAMWRSTDQATNIGNAWGSSADGGFRIRSFSANAFEVGFLGSINLATHFFFAIAGNSVTIAGSGGGGGTTPVNQGVERFYRLSGIVAGAETKLSLIVSAVTDPTLRRIVLTWTALAGATEMILYSSDRQDFRQFAFTSLDGAVVTFSDDNVPRNQTREQLQNEATGGTRELGMRENVKYLVYALLAGGLFSRPGEAILDALVDGDEISADETSFTPMRGDRTVLLTWAAFTDALGYKIVRHTSRHSDYRAFYDQETDVGPAVLTFTDTLVFERFRAPVLLPGVAAGEFRDAKGVVPLIHVGTELIGGTRYQRLLVCGHAVKAVIDVFKSRGDAAGAGRDSAGERDAADNILKVQAAEEDSGAWLIPGRSNYPGDPVTFRDIGGRRYTIVYTTEFPLPDQILANVLGVEDIGDGTGVLIENVLQQFKHWAVNFGIGNYQTGVWELTPGFDQDGKPLVDLESFDTADAVTKQRVAPDGYRGAGVVGNEGEFTSLRTAIARWALSSDVNAGFDNNSALVVSILSEFADLSTTKIFSDTDRIAAGSLSIKDLQDQQFNKVVYAFQYRWAPGSGRSAGGTFSRRYDQEVTVIDQTSIDLFSDTGDALESPALNLRFIRDPIVAADIAGRYLVRVKDPPRRVKFRTNLGGTDVDLGDIIRVTHPEGIGEGKAAGAGPLASRGGWTKNPVRIMRQVIDLNPPYSVTLEGWDVFRIFFESMILGDETALPASFAAATPDESLFAYLGDEVSSTFSDGQPIKRVR